MRFPLRRQWPAPEGYRIRAAIKKPASLKPIDSFLHDTIVREELEATGADPKSDRWYNGRIPFERYCELAGICRQSEFEHHGGVATVEVAE